MLLTENILEHIGDGSREDILKSKEEFKREEEEILIEVANELADKGRTDDLRLMIKKVRPFLVSLGKAKAAMIVRKLVDMCLTIEGQNGEIKIELCKECTQWADEQNRTFLRQSLQARLVKLYNDLGKYDEALKLSNTLVKELKKMDDKDLIVEVQLEEAKACYSLSNFAKSRAALTSARTTANAIYIVPKMQASLDMMSGILHAADEKDFKTGFSYFYEAFEGFDSIDDKAEALKALKYMLLCKVMLDSPDDVKSLLSQKLALKYSGRDLDAMRAVANAAKKRSLRDFNDAFMNYKNELQTDLVVRKHFNVLSDAMLEKDLCRIIEPYDRLEIGYIAKKINLPIDMVEKKLAQMILDNKINGSLNQACGILTIHGEEKVNSSYQTAIETINALGEVVDVLYERAKKIR
uniref:PCI domain-containing protein n=1 Tax=Strongyloides papillosus TaxID=174720 RepID=A0A0N5BAP1_STREA